MAGRAAQKYHNTEGKEVGAELGWLDHQPLPYLIYDVRAPPTFGRCTRRMTGTISGVGERFGVACR